MPYVAETCGYNHGEPIRNIPARAWRDSISQLGGLASGLSEAGAKDLADSGLSLRH
jgi:hypothetical protein